MKFILFLVLTFTIQAFAQVPYHGIAQQRYIERQVQKRKSRVDFSRSIQSLEDENVTLNITGHRGEVNIHIIKIQEVEDFTQDTVVELLNLNLEDQMNYGELRTILTNDELVEFDTHPDVNTIYLCQNEGHYSFDISDEEIKINH